MKSCLSFAGVLFVIFSHAQNLQIFSVPKGYQKIAEARGDLDRDGKDEVVMIFDTDQSVSADESLPEGKDYQRVFYILKAHTGGLSIWKENRILLFSSGTGFYPEDNGPPEISIKNNSLTFTQTFNTNSRHTQVYKHTFRFQNGDFYLIGSHDQFEDTCDFNFLSEINFSTGKVIIDKAYSSCDENSKIPENTHKEFIYKPKTLIKMNTFKIGAQKFKIPGSHDNFIF
ncbi:hypothetical protein [Chryseobacterium sp.]|uniref:hypothetical protein n=1 Tax=Chryseobacterium sp. TaxID=1871047 RepID=UPI0025C0FA3B|nr:hypothetical protein [Chryseobacterium sp.]MBV8328233.1 hypothetical protein [Chryseobacterium sp.]